MRSADDSDARRADPEETQRPPRQYWSRRHGITPSLTLLQVCKVFSSTLGEFDRLGYFDEWFGYVCVDLGDVPGRAGSDRAAFVERRTFRDDLWPFRDRWPDWDEAALLTAVEFYYDHVSEGVQGTRHDYMDCGMHWDAFDPAPARARYRQEANELLFELGDGYELLPSGEVVHRAPPGLESLFAARPVPIAGKRYEERIEDAVRKFRSRTASPTDRRDAVRDLADVLEFLRPEIKRVLTKKDDAALFEIANKFAIRHMDGEQFTEYTKPVWLSWMFYFYLATIYAVGHLIERVDSPGYSPS